MSDDFSPDDPLPALQAELDQAAAMAPMIAQVAWSYYLAFKVEGFGDAQSLYLAVCQMKDNPGKAP